MGNGLIPHFNGGTSLDPNYSQTVAEESGPPRNPKFVQKVLMLYKFRILKLNAFGRLENLHYFRMIINWLTNFTATRQLERTNQ